LELARVSEPVGAGRLFKYFSLYEICTVQSAASCAPFKIKLTTAAAVMPVRVKNSTTGAGSDSGKKPVCVCASALIV